MSVSVSGVLIKTSLFFFLRKRQGKLLLFLLATSVFLGELNDHKENSESSGKVFVLFCFVCRTTHLHVQGTFGRVTIWLVYSGKGFLFGGGNSKSNVGTSLISYWNKI